jgi:hypothetical protein
VKFSTTFEPRLPADRRVAPDSDEGGTVLKLSRAARAARDLWHRERREVPVPVIRIARRYATLVRRPLPPHVSGMLVPIDEPDAERKWAIVINESHSSARQRFTVAHELGHILLHRFSRPHADGRIQVRFRDTRSSDGNVREEIEANEFAAELLMPERYVRPRAVRWALDVMDPRSDKAALTQLRTEAKKLRVSVQALSFRIANLGLT